jgi:hypothetical protein
LAVEACNRAGGSRRTTARRTLAVAAGLWLALVPAAASHGPGALPALKNVKPDPAEVAVLGRQHALQHARLRALEGIAHRRWLALSPPQRRERVQAADRETRQLNRQVGAKPRDDVGFWGDQKGSLFPLLDSAIHTTMLPTGDLLVFGREPLQPDGSTVNLGSASVFDPDTGRSHSVDPPPIPENGGKPAAIYCGAQAVLSDGRILVVGGNLGDKPGLAGLKYTFIFDPWTEKWQIGPQMSHGRWYPSIVKLPSGDILIMSGLDETGTSLDKNPTVDIFRPGIDDKATSLTPFPGGFREINNAVAPGGRHDQSLYPGLFTLPDGNVLLAGPGKEDSAILNTQIATDRGKPLGSAWTQLSTSPSEHYGAPAVLEPQMNSYGGSWKVLIVGGKVGLPGTQLGRRVTEEVDVNPAGSRRWKPAKSKERLKKSRYWPNNVLLPDGGMVVVGGGSGYSSGTINEYYVSRPAPAKLRQVELRRPGESTWRLGAAQLEWRTYHSTAALLTDGRIFSGGDDYHEGPDPFTPLPSSVRRDSAEFYWPPYLFNGNSCAPRPVIRAVGSGGPPADPRAPWATLAYGETFGIFSEHAKRGMKAVLVAPSAVTHSFNMNQRVVPLKVTGTVTAGGVNVQAPAAAGIAPPGWYMLFVVGGDGTPSVSRWVKLLPRDQASAQRGGAAPARVAGVWPKPHGRVCVNPDGTIPTATKATSGLSIERAAIRRPSGKLEVFARFGARATGTVRVTLRAGKRSKTFKTKISRHRISVLRTLPTSLAKSATGTVTIRYGGDARTQAQTARVLAARTAAGLTMQRPTLTAGRLRASGSISTRARGVVHLQLQFLDGDETTTVQVDARIAGGAWKFDGELSAGARSLISQRRGTLNAYALFSGYKRAGIRGEMRSSEVLGAR